MTEREHRLRRRIDTLLAERDQAHATLHALRTAITPNETRAERPRFSYCRWCGSPCYGRVCHQHRDLEQTEAETFRQVSLRPQVELT